MTNKVKQIALFSSLILVIGLVTVMPFFLENKILLRSIQIMVLIVMLATLIGRIYYLEKKHEKISYKNAFLIAMLSIFLILIGKLFVN